MSEQDFNKDLGSEEEELMYDIVTLEDEEGEEHQFELIDSAEFEGEEYRAMLPIFDDEEEMLNDSGELILMRIAMEDGEEFLDIIEDDEEYYRVAEFFMERLSDEFDFEEGEYEEE